MHDELEREAPPLDAVLLHAAALDGDERAAYLREIAASWPRLAEEVERRLEHAESADDSFLDVPAAERLRGAVADDESTATLALQTRPSEPAVEPLAPEERYALGEELGAGGMGRVVLADDRQLDRPVALKFLHAGDPARQRRLLAEARAQARVRHDHVLDVYDSGVLAGRPFIAMRHVAGGTLADLGPSEPLERRVRLLMQTARGLHAAHRQGLLHRDIKASNVLVEDTDDDGPRALVTDFGLALDVGAVAAAAEHGTAPAGTPLAGTPLAGTPQYVAPELLLDPDAVADRRADVYSLGVTMYRVLTGHLPYTAPHTLAVLLRAAEADFRPPREVAPTLPVELEAIVLRCLARDPDARYASARAVADDLQRFLDGEVAEAYAASLAYRVTRFVLRNKVLSAMAVTTILALAVASVLVALFAVRADRARERAELRQGQAEELIRFMVVDLQGKLESLGRLDVLRDVGEAASEYFRSVPADELSEDELLRRSRMLYQIGDVHIRQGDLATAAAPMDESRRLARRLAELAPDDPDRLFALGQSEFWVGYLHWEQGDLDAARAPFEAYLDVSERLVARDPERLDWLRELAYARSNLGSLLDARGDFEAALEQFRAALDLETRLAAAEPSDVARSEVAASHNTVALVLQSLGRLDEADEHLRRALDIRSDLGADTPPQRELLAASLGHLGIHRLMQGRLDEATDLFDSMHEHLVALTTHDPDNSRWRYQLAWSHLHRAMAAAARGSRRAALAEVDAGLGVIEQAIEAGDDAPRWRRSQAIARYLVAYLERDDPAARVRMLVHLDDSVRALEELLGAEGDERSVRRWLAHALLLRASLLPSQDAARVDVERAVAVLEPIARGSRDGRVVAPWAEALACLGRGDEVAEARAAVRASGFHRMVLAAPCAGTRI